jgi:hypothetical protein
MQIRTPQYERRHMISLLKLYVPIALIVFVVVGLTIAKQLDIGQFTRDPAALTDSSPFNGVLSSIGVLFWAATVAICCFSALILWQQHRHQMALFLLAAGLITSLLLLDDLFMFHELVFPQYLHFGEKITVVLYAIIVVSFLWRFRQQVLGTDYSILLIALGLMGFSVLADRIFSTLGSWEYLLEDGPKLFGIVAWFGYWSQSALTTLDRLIAQKV